MHDEFQSDTIHKPPESAALTSFLAGHLNAHVLHSGLLSAPCI